MPVIAVGSGIDNHGVQVSSATTWDVITFPLYSSTSDGISSGGQLATCSGLPSTSPTTASTQSPGPIPPDPTDEASSSTTILGTDDHCLSELRVNPSSNPWMPCALSVKGSDGSASGILHSASTDAEHSVLSMTTLQSPLELVDTTLNTRE